METLDPIFLSLQNLNEGTWKRGGKGMSKVKGKSWEQAIIK